MNKYELKELLEKVQKKEIHYTDAEFMLDKNKKENHKKSNSNDKNKIAVIGFSCRFPQADNVDEFWDNILNSKDCITEIPKERWDIEGFYTSNPNCESNTSYSKWGGFLKSIINYDMNFLAMNKNDILSMDPQQLLVMEVAWEALEHSGYGAIRKESSNTGVFLGARANNFRLGMLDKDGIDNVESFDRNYIIGKAPNMISARLSDFLNLKGPSMVIDTACSSSLVSIHSACRSILAGDCSMALAGGVDLLVNKDSYVGLSKAKAISPDGKCFTFDKRANGYVPGEGAGIVVLKEYNKAIEDGDMIYAVILGSAVNNDGHTMGITTPDLNSQKELIKKALNNSNVLPESITYVEAHGTGTAIGDPIEIKALTETFRESTNKKGFCAIGSVKTNIGHLHSAAGIAGFIKLILCIHKKTLVPTINCDKPNPRFNFVDSPFYPISKATKWENYGDTRRAAISSFGFGGTNCNIIIEECKNKYIKDDGINIRLPFVLSAQSLEGLNETIKKYIYFLDRNKYLSYKDVAFVANTGRLHFENRLALSACSIEELLTKLRKVNEEINEEHKSKFIGLKTKKLSKKLVVMFTGQGALYTGVSKEIYDNNKSFRECLDKCSNILMPYIGKSINELLFNKENSNILSSTYITQPVTFALDYSLYMLWKSMGMEPSVVMGHSLGEYVAACVSGALKLEDALMMVAIRGRLMDELPRDGSMAALFTNSQEVNELIMELDLEERTKVSIAAINSDDNTVISGNKIVVEAICKKVKERSKKFALLQVSHAFHSPLMEPILDKYKEAIHYISPNKIEIKIISNVTGEFIDGESLTEDYWLSHIMGTVLFSNSIENLVSNGYKDFLEIGPSTTLTQLATKIVGKRSDINVFSTLCKGKNDWEHIFDTFGKLFISGFDFDLSNLFKLFSVKKVALPLYSFIRKEIINYNEFEKNKCTFIKDVEKFDGILLDKEEYLAYFKVLDPRKDRVIKDHIVGESYVVPGVYQLKLATIAVQSLWSKKVTAIKDMRFLQSITVKENENLLIRVRVFKQDDNIFKIDMWDEVSNDFKEASCGKYSFEDKVDNENKELWNFNKNGLNVEAHNIYNYLDNIGLHYGSFYKGIKKVETLGNTAIGQLEIADDNIQDKVLHPGIVDSALQVVSAFLYSNNINDKYVPFCINEVEIFKEITDMSYRSKVDILDWDVNSDILKSNIYLIDNDGKLILKFKEICFKKIKAPKLDDVVENSETYKDLLFKPVWIEKTVPMKTIVECKKTILVFMDDKNKLHEEILLALEEHYVIYKVFRNSCSIIVDGYAFNLLSEEYGEFLSVAESIKKINIKIDSILYLWSLDDYDDTTKLINLNKPSDGLNIIYIIRALKEQKINYRLNIVTITNNCQPVLGGKEVLHPEKSEVLGVIKTIPLEFEEIQAMNIDVDCCDYRLYPIHKYILNEMLVNNTDNFVGYRNDKRFIMAIEKISDFKPTLDNSINFRDNGTYVVLGGSGGLGVEIIKHIANKVRATFIIISRRQFPAISEWGKILADKDYPFNDIKNSISAFKEVISCGSRVTFYKGDITNYSIMKGIFENIRIKFAQINGVIHSAGVLSDSLIMNMTNEKFYKVLRPKMNGAIIVDSLTENDSLDFMILFSGLVSYVGIVGQSNHTAANFFEDSFTYYRNYVKKKRTLTINWGIWGTTGVVAKPMYINTLNDKGFKSMRVDEALSGFDKILSTDMKQVGIGHISKEKQVELLYEKHNGISKKDFSEDIQYIKNIREYDLNFDKLLSKIDENYEVNFGIDLNRLCIAFIMGYFNSKGVFVKKNSTYAINEIYTICNVLPKFYKLIDSMISTLNDSKVIVMKTENSIYYNSDFNINFREVCDEFKYRYKNEAIYGIILEKCYVKYDEVLSGKLNSMNVLFANGNINTMEKLYHLPSPYNLFIGTIIKKMGSSYEETRKIKILEIGGGTGGTTTKILPEIQNLNIEYTFSDISPVLVKHASETFKDYNFIKYTQLNIEKDPWIQNMENEKFDIIIAANVLHATESLDNTFEHVKKLMDSNGTLIMMETTMITSFADLVFGITDGWWKFKDVNYRNSSTLLTPEQWRFTLSKFGFNRITTLPLRDRKSVRYPYSIIMVDGIGHGVDYSKKSNNNRIFLSEKIKIHDKKEKDKVIVHENKLKVLKESNISDFIKNLVISKIYEVSGIEKTSISSSIGFLEMGLDSLTLVSLSGVIEKEANINLYPTIFFEYQTIDDLVKYLCEKFSDNFQKIMGLNNKIEIPTEVVEESNRISHAEINYAINENDIVTEDKGITYDKDDIAIIGMSGVFPGAKDVYSLWENLKIGFSSIKEIDKLRWNDWQVYSANHEKGRTYCKWAGIIDDYDKFDPKFFNISVREAKRMDPQQRLFLETAWSTVENAGYSMKKLSGEKVGVFVGVSNHNYHSISYDENDSFCTLSTSNAMVANRFSYFMNLNGPSLTIDTQCSSSMVALNYACKSILSGECEMAIAGGVNVIIPKEYYILLSQVKAISKDGKCKTFDKTADGFISGEGTAALLIKPLSKAIKDRDNIHAVIKSIAVNHDGKSSNVSAPNANSQFNVITDAMKNGNINPESISYIEAHGTGTSLGDPIEVSALTKSFQQYTDKKGFCGIGSLKTNIGHLESAAGIAGIIKVVLSMKHRIIPPTLNFNEPNSYINFNETPFYVVDKPMEWKDNGPLRAGISSFGMGGTNCHTILEEAPKLYQERTKEETVKPFNLFTISAKSKESLKMTIEKIIDYIGSDLTLRLDDICHTMNVGRNHFENRVSIVTNSTKKLYKLMKDTLKEDFRAESKHLRGVNCSLSINSNNKQKNTKVAYIVSDRKFKVDNINSTFNNGLFQEGFEIVKSIIGLDLLNYEEIRRADYRKTPYEKGINEIFDLVVKVLIVKILSDCNIVPEYIFYSDELDLPSKVISGQISFIDAIKEIAIEYGININKTINLESIQIPLANIRSLDEIEDIYTNIIDEDNKLIVIENGPDEFYTDMINYNESFESSLINGVAIFESGATECYSFVQLMGVLYSFGVNIDFKSFCKLFNGKIIDLPTYAFEKKSYWANIDKYPIVMHNFEKSYVLNNKTLSNRIVKSATEIGMADEKGLITEEYLNYYKKWSSIEASIKIVGNIIISNDGKMQKNQVVISNKNKQLEKLKRLSNILKTDGALILAQLNHGGLRDAIHDGHKIDIDDLKLKGNSKSLEELSESHIETLINNFVETAFCMKLGGFDGVQIHAAHGYLLSQFLSLKNNKRSDKWGGKIENRAAIILSIVNKIKEQLGSDFIVSVKLDMPSEENELGLEELVTTIQIMEKVKVDIIELSSGIITKEDVLKLKKLPIQKQVLRAIRGNVKNPIIITGGFRTLDVIEDIISNEYADFIGIGRPFICEDDFVKKLKIKSEENIKCSSCSMCLYSISNGGLKCVKEKNLENASDFNFRKYMFEEVEFSSVKKKEIHTEFSVNGIYALLGEINENLVAVKECLDKKGSYAFYVKQGEGFNKENDNYVINYGNVEDYITLMKEITIKWGDKFKGFINIATYNEAIMKENEDGFKPDSGIFIQMNICKAIIACKVSQPLKMVTATFNGLALYSDNEIIPENTILLGFNKNISYEVKNITNISLDFDKNIESRDLATKIILEMAGFNGGYNEVAYRNNNRLERKVVQATQKLEYGKLELANGIYVIIGGLSGLGYIFAEYLIKNKAKAIYLTGRKEIEGKFYKDIESNEIKKLELLRKASNGKTLIKYEKSDVSKYSDLNLVIEEITSKHGQITGIIHCAGVVDSVNRTLRTKTYHSFNETIKPKVQGTMNLGKIFMNILPEFMVFCSSISSLSGRFGATLCDYAAGNFFMNEYAKMLAKKSGKKVVSINWPLWKGVGLGSRKAYGGDEYSIDSNIGIKLFDIILKSKNCGNKVILNGDRDDFTLDDLLNDDSSIEQEENLQVSNNHNNVEENVIKISNVEKTKNKVKEYLKGLLVEFLQLDFSQVDDYTEFSDYGIDSVIVADIVGDIEKTYKIFAHPSIILEYPTINDLANFLVEKYNITQFEDEDNTKSKYIVLSNNNDASDKDSYLSGEKNENIDLDENITFSDVKNNTDLSSLLDNIYKGEINVDEALEIFGGEL